MVHEKLIENIDRIMEISVESYKKVFETFYPAFGLGGLTERNQSFNFCRNYMSVVENSIAWQELPIIYGEKEWNGYIDSLIIDNENKIIIQIEAKRIKSSRVKDQINSIKGDYSRLSGTCKFPYKENYKNSFNHEDYETYILLLVDVWYNNKNNKDQRNRVVENWESDKDFADKTELLSAKKYEVGIPRDNETYYIAYRLLKKV